MHRTVCGPFRSPFHFELVQFGVPPVHVLGVALNDSTHFHRKLGRPGEKFLLKFNNVVSTSTSLTCDGRFTANNLDWYTVVIILKNIGYHGTNSSYALILVDAARLDAICTADGDGQARRKSGLLASSSSQMRSEYFQEKEKMNEILESQKEILDDTHI
ncbi:hypothetical protein L218DRAFT_950603 [Marasmius fiardii PR-910]|nr:hypothetical protein L218DRAFT_950603 [Marasmius fiardii PR-910]